MAQPKGRPTVPRPMRLTERDKVILQTIYEFEGLLSRRQIATLCFGGNVDTAWKRLRKLFENGYVAQPDAHEIHRVPEMIYWLDRAGLEVVAGLMGEEPLYSDTAKREAPQWAKVEHDLAVNDFRMAVGAAITATPDLALGVWVNEKTMTHWADEVTWTAPNGRPARKRFAPDGFFTITRPRPGEPHEEEIFAFLLEIDRATHSNPKFADEKVRPGIAYLTSEVYRERYGVRFGRFVVVTTGGKRLENMRKQAARIRGGEVFYFTTFAQVTPETVLTAPIWMAAGKDQPFALIPR